MGSTIVDEIRVYRVHCRRYQRTSNIDTDARTSRKKRLICCRLRRRQNPQNYPQTANPSSPEERQKMTMETEFEDSTSAVPENVSDSVKRTLINVQEISSNFDEFLPLSDPEVLAQLSPVQRAQSLLALSRLTTGLFACNSSISPSLWESLFSVLNSEFVFFRTVKLRCAGVRPDDHRVKGEMVGSDFLAKLIFSEPLFGVAIFLLWM